MKKILSLSLVALGTAGMIGGGTFASWSDWDTINANTSGAGQLVLDVTTPQNSSSETGFEVESLAPGEFKDIEMFLASTNGDAVPDAELYMTFTDLDGVEDGCTSTSEEFKLPGVVNDDNCANTSSPGEFINQAVVDVYGGIPTTNADGDVNGCNINGDSGARFDWVEVPLADLVDGVDDRLNITNFATGTAREALDPGEELCVRVVIKLPNLDKDVNNQAQGDSATFNLLFEADQIVGTGGGNGYGDSIS